MTEFKNIQEWCNDYSKKTGVKIYPQSAPLQLLIEDLLGQFVRMQDYMKNLTNLYDHLNERIDYLESRFIEEKPKKREKK